VNRRRCGRILACVQPTAKDTCSELEALRPAVRKDGAQALGLTYLVQVSRIANSLSRNRQAVARRESPPGAMGSITHSKHSVPERH
jgi:hypothetical protein